MIGEESERGRPASFDPKSGAVHGSGAGAGGFGNPDEDYDSDPGAGSGAEAARPDGAAERTGQAHHPLPASEEARHEEIPEHLEREKGRGDDSAAATQASDEAVDPDGEPYRIGREAPR